MNTTTKVIAVLIVLGAIGGGAYLLRKDTPSEPIVEQQTTETPEQEQPTVTTASSTLPVASGDIDSDLAALSAEAAFEGTLAADNTADGTAAMDDRADITSINDSYGENNF